MTIKLCGQHKYQHETYHQLEDPNPSPEADLRK